MYLNAPAPAGASSGTHYLRVSQGTGEQHRLYGKSAYGSSVRFQYGIWLSAGSDKEPPNEAEQQHNEYGLLSDADNPIRIYYKNDTDVSQTGTRSVRILVKKIRI